MLKNYSSFRHLGDGSDNAGEVVDSGEGEDVDPHVRLDPAADELSDDAHHAEQVHLQTITSHEGEAVYCRAFNVNNI
jgi:hypothetical protein